MTTPHQTGAQQGCTVVGHAARGGAFTNTGHYLLIAHTDADKVYVWNEKLYKTVSVWQEDADGVQLKRRAIDSEDNSDVQEAERVQEPFKSSSSNLKKDKIEQKDAFSMVSVKRSESQSGRNWIVNVKSCGPNRVLNDYDDIWSNPDDFE